MSPENVTHQKLRAAYYNDPTVRAVLLSGGDAEDCVLKLLEKVEVLHAELMKLHSIVPRKVRLPDGKIMIWRCPDHMVPELPIGGAS